MCVSLSVDDIFGSASDLSLEIFERFTSVVNEIGPFDYSITRSGVGFAGTHRVFAAVRPTRRGLGGFIDLTYEVDDERFSKVEPYTKGLFIHKLALTHRDQLDDNFTGWIRDAHDVGAGHHLRGSTETPRPRS